MQRPDVKIYRVERREGPTEVVSIQKNRTTLPQEKIATRFTFAMATTASKSKESFGISDDGFPSLSRVSTVPQRGTSQHTAPHYISAAQGRGSHDTHGNSARCPSPRRTYLIRYDTDPGSPRSLSSWSPSYVPKTSTKQRPLFLFLFLFTSGPAACG